MHASTHAAEHYRKTSERQLIVGDVTHSAAEAAIDTRTVIERNSEREREREREELSQSERLRRYYVHRIL